MAGLGQEIGAWRVLGGVDVHGRMDTCGGRSNGTCRTHGTYRRGTLMPLRLKCDAGRSSSSEPHPANSSLLLTSHFDSPHGSAWQPPAGNPFSSADSVAP
jgi:hypothetical protein